MSELRDVTVFGSMIAFLESDFKRFGTARMSYTEECILALAHECDRLRDSAPIPSPRIGTDAPGEDASVELGRAFGMLAFNGIPQDRAKTVSNGIDVLVTRYQHELTGLRAQLAEATAHEEQTHAELGAILGIDTSLLDGARRMAVQLAEERAKPEPQAEASGELDREWPCKSLTPVEAAKEWIIGYDGRRGCGVRLGAYERVADAFAVALLSRPVPTDDTALREPKDKSAEESQ